MRVGFLLLVLASSGCQCLQPVDEFTASDAGNRFIGTVVREFGLGPTITSSLLGTCFVQEPTATAQYGLLFNCPGCQIALGP